VQAAVEDAVRALLPDVTERLLALARREKSAALFLLADRVGALDDERAKALARDRSPAVIQAFTVALKESGRSSAVLERWLAVVARHTAAQVRALAADVAATRGGALAERIGRQMLADADPAPRVAALKAMGASRRREALPDLTRALDSGGEAEQVAAAEALGTLGLPDVVPVLERVLERKGLLRRRRGATQYAAARALKALPGGLGEAVLERFRDDRDAELRRIVADSSD
jgi:HEAT repeat protein